MSEFGQLPGQQFYLEITIGKDRYNPNNIQYLVIKEWIFNILPTIELQIIDEGYLTEVVPIEDATDIKIVLAKNEDDKNTKEMTFTIDDYNVGIQGDNRKSIVTISGHLKADNMFRSQGRSFSQQNSARVLEQIAIESKLKFSNPHNIVPSDSMTWHQSAKSNYDFIRHVIKRAYIPSDSMFCYINTENEFVITSLNSEIEKKDVKRAKFSVENSELNVKDDEDPDDTIWFNTYSIVNYSGYFNKRVGYGVGYAYYDLDGKEQFKEFSNIKKLTKLSFRNKKNVGDIFYYNTNTQDYVESNVYSEKYFESISRNHFLMDNFFANSVVLNVNALSQVNLMDTLDVDIPSLISREQSNKVMSGFYLVAGVQHEISNGGIYRKKIALGRNGMNESSAVKKYEVE